MDERVVIERLKRRSLLSLRMTFGPVWSFGESATKVRAARALSQTESSLEGSGMFEVTGLSAYLRCYAAVVLCLSALAFLNLSRNKQHCLQSEAKHNTAGNALYEFKFINVVGTVSLLRYLGSDC